MYLVKFTSWQLIKLCCYREREQKRKQPLDVKVSFSGRREGGEGEKLNVSSISQRLDDTNVFEWKNGGGFLNHFAILEKGIWGD
jgi:hypothetical protein